MKKLLGISSITVLVLVLLAAGCGEPDEAEVPEEDPAEEEVAVEEEDEDVATEEEAEEIVEDEDGVYFESDQYILPETFAEFIATFKEIQYTGGNVDGETTTVRYNHVGVEEVDGVQTDKVEFGVEGEGLFALWVDSEGNFQRVIADGEEIPVEMAQMLAEPVKNAAMWPFYHASQQIDIENVFGRPIPGYEQNVVKTETETISGMTATVYTVEASAGPPAVEEELSASATVRIADFGDFQAVLSWETTEPYEGGSKGFLRIDELEFR